VRLRTIVLLGVLAFCIGLIAVLPARWASPALPAGIGCGEWRGSLWKGQCRAPSLAAFPALQLEHIRWTLQPMALLRLALRAQVYLRFPAGEAEALVEARAGGQLRVEALQARAPLNHSVLAALPPGWSGQLEIQSGEIALHDKELNTLSGRFAANELKDRSGASLGGFVLEFSQRENPPFTGQLRDSNGPLVVAADVVVAKDRSWTVQGTLRARDPGDLELHRRLEMFGPAAPDGGRILSAAGEFN
jgi:hypothetical protein